MNTKFAHLDCLAISENIRLPAQCFARTFSITLRRRALRARLRGITTTAVPRFARTFSCQGGGAAAPPTVRPWPPLCTVRCGWGCSTLNVGTIYPLYAQERRYENMPRPLWKWPSSNKFESCRKLIENWTTDIGNPRLGKNLFLNLKFRHCLTCRPREAQWPLFFVTLLPWQCPTKEIWKSENVTSTGAHHTISLKVWWGVFQRSSIYWDEIWKNEGNRSKT